MLGKPCFSQYEIYPISGYFSKFGAHQTMFEDGGRVEVYSKALKQLIKPGESIVLDVGTGTGVLAMIAASLGAKKVYGIEAGSMYYLAKKIVSDNGLEAKIDLIHGMSNEVDLPEKVDIIVSETIGLLGVEEDTVAILSDAKKRFGKNDVQLIPELLTIEAALINDDSHQKISDFWNHKKFGFTFKSINELQKNNIFGRMEIDSRSYLSNKAQICEYQLGKISDVENSSRIEFEIIHPGMLTGLALWFVATLNKKSNISLSSQNWSETNHWQQAVIPFKIRRMVGLNEKVVLNFTFKKKFGWVCAEWKIEILDDNGNLKYTDSGDSGKVISYTHGEI